MAGISKATNIASALAALTGSWRPAKGATDEDLRSARLHIADALASGITFTSTASGGPHDIEEIAAIAALASGKSKITPSIRNVLTSDLFDEDSPGGQEPALTLGPFVDHLGLEHLVDLISHLHSVPISGNAGPLAYLFVDVVSANLGPGSIWIPATSFSIPGFSDGMAGLSFSEGTINAKGPVSLTNSLISVAVGGELTLRLKLKPPEAPTGDIPGVGLDAKALSVSFPDTITLTVTAQTVVVSKVDDCKFGVYGQNVTLKRNALLPKPVDLGRPTLIFPGKPSAASFDFASVKSSDVVPSGHGKIGISGWALQFSGVVPSQIGAASSAGAVVVQLGPGPMLQFADLDKPLHLTDSTLILTPGRITLQSKNAGSTVVLKVSLWQPIDQDKMVEPVRSHFGSEVVGLLRKGATVTVVVTPTSERVISKVKATANLDRPLWADGTRMDLGFDDATLTFVRTTSRLVVGDLKRNVGNDVPASLVIENALLKSFPPQQCLLFASKTGDFWEGSIQLVFPWVSVTPILSDPYASSTPIAVASGASLFAMVTWTAFSNPSLQFNLSDSPTSEHLLAANERISDQILLDVSGAADQFGVKVQSGFGQGVSLDGMALTAEQSLVSVYALPGISWEPVVHDKSKGWFGAASEDDGPPVTMWASSTNLVRVDPDVALRAFGRAGESAAASVDFTLPFGLFAQLVVDVGPVPQRPSFSLVRSKFSNGFNAVRQLSIRARSPVGKFGEIALPGHTNTYPVGGSKFDYGPAMLGNDDPTPKGTSFTGEVPGNFGDPLSEAKTPPGVGLFIDREFGFAATPKGKDPKIPVKRIDLSGYGTSMFSDWHDHSLDDGTRVGVARAKFDVLVGRTATEIVTVVSRLFPHCCMVTRTVIFERYDSGLVLRSDTGWTCKRPAFFEDFSHPAQRMLGAAQWFQNINNIEELHQEPFTSASGFEFIPVEFDADVAIRPGATAISNGQLSSVVPGKKFQGFIQTTPGPIADTATVLEVLAANYPGGVVTGQVHCILNIGEPATSEAPRFTIDTSSLSIGATTANAPGLTQRAIAVAFHGAPRLPRNGSWNVSKRSTSDPAPTPLDPKTSIPIVYGAQDGGTKDWRLLEPKDALSASAPATFYGLMQGMGVAKALFENPVIAPTGDHVVLNPDPGMTSSKFADIGNLLGVAGAFPEIQKALEIPPNVADKLTLAGDGLKKEFKWTLDKSITDQVLLDVGAAKITLQYHGSDQADRTEVEIVLDPTSTAGPRWSLSLAPLTIVVESGGDEVIFMRGSFEASEKDAPGYKNIHVDYGGILKSVTALISGLSTLAAARGGPDLNVGFSGNELTISNSYTLPSIPLGLGSVDDVAIELSADVIIPESVGMQVGIGKKERPASFILDPLCGTACVLLGASTDGLTTYLELGAGLALELDVVVASGSAAVALEISIEANPGKTPVPMITVYLKAALDVLDGLASCSIAVSAGVGGVPDFDFKPKELPDPKPADKKHPLPRSFEFRAMVGISIHVTVGWAVSKDFDETWEFSESIKVSSFYPWDPSFQDIVDAFDIL